MVANVRRAQAELPVPLALEPIAALFDWPDDELDEADFLTEILDATGAGLLLDVANVYANARNRGEDPHRPAGPAAAGADRLRARRRRRRARRALPRHPHRPVPAEVLELVGALCARPAPPALLLERDGHYPPAAALRAELDALAAAAGHPVVT